MPRKPRIHFPGAIYHVIARGNNKCTIFFDEEDYKKYLFICKDYLSVMPINILAYALMPNHIHFLVEVNDIPIWRFVKLVQQRYAQYSHRKYDTCGHLYQGRYKSMLIDSDAYYIQLLCYVNKNRVVAGLDIGHNQYRWTGHYELINNKPFILNVQRMLSLIDDNPLVAREKYMFYFNKDTKFELADAYLDSAPVSSMTVSPATKDMNLLSQVITKKFNIDKATLIGTCRVGNVVNARKLLIYLARQKMDFTGKEVASYLGVSEQYVSKVCHEFVWDKHANLIKILKELENELVELVET